MIHLLLSGPIRKSFRAIPTLETPRLLLRKVLPCDAEDMYRYSKDPETSKYLLWEPHRSISYTKAHIHYLQRLYQEARFFDWALIEKESGRMIGTCGFTEIYERKLEAEVGYVISPEFHRRGFAPEALERVMNYGFYVLKLKSLSGRFMEGNEASRKVLSRLGFCENSKESEYFYKRGKKLRIFTYTLEREQFLTHSSRPPSP